MGGLLMFNRKRIQLLEERLLQAEKRLDELEKKTISQRTLGKDLPPSASQILDEWLNGEEEDNGN